MLCFFAYFTLILNASNRPLDMEKVPLDEIEVEIGGGDVNAAEGSPLVADAPPGKNNSAVRSGCSFFELK